MVDRPKLLELRQSLIALATADRTLVEEEPAEALWEGVCAVVDDLKAQSWAEDDIIEEIMRAVDAAGEDVDRLLVWVNALSEKRRSIRTYVRHWAIARYHVDAPVDPSVVWVGVLVQFRLHGVVPVETQGPWNSVRRISPFYVLEISESPTWRVLSLKTSHYFALPGMTVRVVPEYEEIPSPNRGGSFAPYSWLTAIATRAVSVGDEIARSYRDGPAKAMSQVMDAVSLDDWNQLESDARLLAAITAARYPMCGVEWWGSERLVWVDDDVFAPEAQTVIDGVERSDVDLQDALNCLKSLRVIGQTDTQVARRLSLAGHSLIQARQERINSLERFLGAFRCLEILANTEKFRDKELSDKFRKLQEALPEDAQELHAFVAHIRSKYHPAISDRFAALARLRSPETAEKDSALFRDANAVRNDIMHGRKAGPPRDTPGDHLTRDLLELANRYLRLVVSATAERLKPARLRPSRDGERRAEN